VLSSVRWEMCPLCWYPRMWSSGQFCALYMVVVLCRVSVWCSISMHTMKVRRHIKMDCWTVGSPLVRCTVKCEQSNCGSDPYIRRFAGCPTTGAGFMAFSNHKIQGLFKDLKLQFSSTKIVDKKTYPWRDASKFRLQYDTEILYSPIL